MTLHPRPDHEVALPRYSRRLADVSEINDLQERFTVQCTGTGNIITRFGGDGGDGSGEHGEENSRVKIH